MARVGTPIQTAFGLVTTLITDNVDFTGSGEHFISADEGASYGVVVFAYKLICSDAVTALTLEASGGEVLDGPYHHLESGGSVEAYNPQGHFLVPAGERLVLGLSDAIHVGGKISYGLVKLT
jgi:hypothetical protein